MSSPFLEPGMVIPKPQTARIFGILNIIFAVVLIFFAYSSAFMLMFAPAGAAVMKAWQKGMERQIRLENTRQIQRLEKLVEAARTDVKRAQHQARLDQVKAQPVMNFASMSMGFEQLEDKSIRNYSLVEAGLGAVMNIVMLVAGFGLLQLKDWGRQISIWLSGVKLVWIFVALIYMVVVIFPLQARLTQKQLQDTMVMQTKGGGRAAVSPVNPQQMSQFVMASSTASAVFGVLIAATYPVLSIWMLSRPPVRAACRSPKSDLPPEWSL